MTDRVVLVTGAAGGIGRATAARFAAEGWHVIGCDRVDATAGPWADFLTVDLGDRDGTDHVLAHLAGSRLDALVNNAALQVDRSLADTTDEDWQTVMSVNLDAAFRLIRGTAASLEATGGAVVNVSSVHAVATSANVAAYAVSKAALAGLTRTAAVELAPRSVRVNAVLPGAVLTPMLDAGLGRRDNPDGDAGNRAASNLATIVARTPLGFVATPEQIAPSIVFLADGERSPYTTGQVLVVDGGATARLSTE